MHISTIAFAMLGRISDGIGGNVKSGKLGLGVLGSGVGSVGSVGRGFGGMIGVTGIGRGIGPGSTASKPSGSTYRVG